VWLNQLPASLRAQIVAKWGEPEQSKTMVWHDETGSRSSCFRRKRWGKSAVRAATHARLGQDIEAVYHDVTLPPHHQYLAFYLWLQRAFRLTRWSTSARTPRTNGCRAKKSVTPPPTRAKSLSAQWPQLYPYIVDDIGGRLAGQAPCHGDHHTHLPPPLDRATINPELREISGLINDYHVAREKGSVASDDTLGEIARRCEKTGLFKDLGITLAPKAQLNKEHLKRLTDHIEKIGEKLTPLGCTRSAWRPMRQTRRHRRGDSFARTKSLARRACAAAKRF